jgi:hypothetical protein
MHFVRITDSEKQTQMHLQFIEIPQAIDASRAYSFLFASVLHCDHQEREIDDQL